MDNKKRLENAIKAIESKGSAGAHLGGIIGKVGQVADTFKSQWPIAAVSAALGAFAFYKTHQDPQALVEGCRIALEYIGTECAGNSASTGNYIAGMIGTAGILGSATAALNTAAAYLVGSERLRPISHFTQDYINRAAHTVMQNLDHPKVQSKLQDNDFYNRMRESMGGGYASIEIKAERMRELIDARKNASPERDITPDFSPR